MLEGGVVNLQFYNLKTKQKVEIPDNQVEIITMKNGRKAAQAFFDMGNGQKMKMFKIVGKEDLERLGK